jgi:hypothetical protein
MIMPTEKGKEAAVCKNIGWSISRRKMPAMSNEIASETIIPVLIF